MNYKEHYLLKIRRAKTDEEIKDIIIEIYSSGYDDALAECENEDNESEPIPWSDLD